MNQISQNSSRLSPSIAALAVVVIMLSGNAGPIRAQSPPAFSLGPATEQRLANVGPTTATTTALTPTSTPSSTTPTSTVPRLLNPAAASPWASNRAPVRVAGATQPNQHQQGHQQGTPYYQPAGHFESPAGQSLSTPTPSTFASDVLAFPAQGSPAPAGGSQSFNDLLTDQAEQLITREGTGSSVKIAILLAALSLAPALILMTTCYVRVVVVLTLLRQAFGAQQLPSTQILTALSLFVTFLVMAPTWNEIKSNAIDPYTHSDSEITFEEAIQRAVMPVKRFMSRQITLAKNEDSVVMFYRYLPPPSGTDATDGSSTFGQPATPPTSMQEVPLNVLLPAFLVSELKVAFLLGFQVYLPFLIVDLVVSSVTVSMGMVMLPPTMVSFPLKLILFVMVDGWALVVGMLMQSFGTL